jgi:acyl-coenzyme A synthetase/AMP-(fatty) acid ligase
MIAAFVYAAAERAPEQPALVVNGRALTYGEFARAIEAMIQSFEGAGIGGEGYAVVAVYDLMEHWIVSLALRELGLTTVPVHSAANARDLNLTHVRCAVTQADEDWPGLEPLCQTSGWPLVRLRWAGAMANPLEVGRLRAAHPGEHVLQTSATTGAYKKVLIARRFEPELIELRREGDSLDERARYALFDFGAWTAAGYMGAAAVWLGGGTVVQWQGAEAHRCLEMPGLTHADTMPDLLARVLAAPEGTIPFQGEMTLFLSGGTPRQAQVDAAHARLTPLVWNSIGATEALTFAETRLLTPDDRRWHELRPERDPQVVDDADRPVGVGEIGSLRVSTKGGPNGYLDDAAATARFFKDGYFYTGDLAMLRGDGRMALMGRTTDVINIGGQKISPAPFEDAICERLGVTGACLFSRPGASGEEELHLVLEAPAPLDVSTLTRALRRTLRGFPRAEVRYTSKLPRNANGKLLRGEVQRRAAEAAKPRLGA